MLKIAEYAQKKEEFKEKVKMAFVDAKIDFDLKKDKSNRIRLVFAGQYSAGKSSILKMLTGRNDIAIGAGITTQQAHSYNWNGLEVVDTPGIHTELRPDHDDISYEAIASSDMLVFVVTNELFDSYIADHFRKLAIDKDKAGEMILVVNKMERTAEGNCPSQQDIIREDLRKVLAPYTPEQLNLTFLDAESYLDSLKEREMDAELADGLVERSGYNEFINTLNKFVAEKSMYSKLTTELYVLDEQLDKAIEDLQPSSTDADIDALEESFMQQRRLLIEERNKLKQEVRGVYTLAASKIRDIGQDAANLLVEGCKQDEVETALTQFIRQVENIIETSQSEAKEILTSRLKEIEIHLEEMENSEFSKNLKIRLSGKFDKLPEKIQKVISNVSMGFKEAGNKVLNNACKAGPQGGLTLTNFSGSSVHQMVLKAGNSLVYKFKPMQAIKVTKGIAIGGQIMSILGVGLSVFMQIRADQEEEQMREDLRRNRQNIRSQFNIEANELEDFSKLYINYNIEKPLEKSIAEIDNNINDIRITRSNRSRNCLHMEKLQKECRILIQNIHSEIME